MLALLGTALVVVIGCSVGVGRLAQRAAGRGFLFGAVLIGALASAPELYLAVHASSRGMPDLVSAGLLGGILCNLTWLLAAFVVTGRAGRGVSVLLAAVASLLGVAVLLVALGAPEVADRLGVGLALVLVYALWVGVSFQREGAESVLPARFGLLSGLGVLMALSGVAASFLCVELIQGGGLAGALWVALVSSLPELALVFVAAWGQSPELGSGAALGATLVNLLLFGVADFFSPAPLLASLLAPRLHLFLVAGVVFFLGLVLFGLVVGRGGQEREG